MSEAPDPRQGWRRWEAPTVGKSRDGSASARGGKTARPRGKSASPQSRRPHDPPVTAAEIESIQEAAYEEAWQKGHEEGLEAGREAARHQADAVAALLDAMAEPLQAMDDALEREMVDLVCIIARKLIRRELRTAPDQIVAVVREAVNALPSSDRRIHVQLHPEDARLIRELTGAGGQDARWELVEDPSLSRGGCIVSDRNSTVDARLEHRIGRVLSSMLGDGREVPGEMETEDVEAGEPHGPEQDDPAVTSRAGNANEQESPGTGSESGDGGPSDTRGDAPGEQDDEPLA
ncbi:FliH/SctL family protein [Natronospira bacteriovora]|uniref:Flagellar assembly protein FliH n=1 Tax=Natronospira bacteriovora TaxID=3069753 RepID=A0ABU0W386_9GAMM|nr:flagellar assembly protein FliH [Natronospira sp. AB-CW4]MDQ2068472.1 flagellar assembly protein FliH [Natronospira sp. AB-CW4]